MSAILADLLSRCDGPTLHIEKSRRLTSLWAGYGSVWHVLAREKGGNQKNLVVKEVSPPAASGVSHDRKLHSYQVEAAFYEEVADTLEDFGLPIASHLAVENNLSSSGGTMFLVLSDLRENFPSSQSGMLDLAHAKAALTWLATLHACYWQKEISPRLWAQGTYWHLETRQEELEEMGAEWAELQAAAQWINDELANPQFRTLVHGDFKAANICFTAGGGAPQAAAYDFQYTGAGDAMKDVAYLLLSSVQRVDRHEAQLLQHYHAELCRKLPPQAAAAYSFDSMQQRWKLAVCDYVRFMAGWGFWGSSEHARQLYKDYFKEIMVAANR